MKNFLFLFVLLVLFSNISIGQDFYDLESVHTIEIEFEETDWDAILDDYFDNDIGERLIATVIIDGVTYDSCGVKYKGNSSYDVDRVKNPFNIKLDYIRPDQKIQGYETLKLSNAFRDPSFVREVLGYEIGQKYCPTSKANYTNLYINGELWGLYTNVEAVNKDFIRSRYFENDGPFFKGDIIMGPPEPGCPGGPGVGIWAYLGEDSACYEKFYVLEGDDGFLELMHMLDTFNNEPAFMEEVLNLDRHLWVLAFNSVLASMDSPGTVAHNFYLYEDINGRFNHILWDLNMVFGTFSGGDAPETLTEMQELSPYYHNTASYPIISQVLQDDRYTKMYLAHMKTILEENFSSGEYLERIEYLQGLVDADVDADLNKFYTYSDFIDNIENTIGTNIYGIQELMEGREDYLNSLPEFMATQPEITAINISPELVYSNSTVTITALITDADYAYLGTREHITGRFIKTEMYDDGAHGDGSAGDNVYGAEITVGSSEIQYYIYAENDDASMFSPVRAEYEFHTLSVLNDVVINEFSASNQTIQADQDGEFDDWIELYNNTDTDISLEGYYLSDNDNNLLKWTFPAVTIGANDYLIVWADEDTLQDGLHANFKLSADGETLFLSNNSEELIGEVIFSTQTADVTYGRFPNGVGIFTFMSPTFDAENNDLLTVTEESIAITETTFSIYPNPTNALVHIDFTVFNLNESLVIYNLMGEQVYEAKTEENMIIEVGDWTPGFYLVVANDHVEKLVVQ